MNFADLTQQQWIDIILALVIFLGTAVLGRWIIKLFFSRILRRFTVSQRIRWMMLFWTPSRLRCTGWL